MREDVAQDRRMLGRTRGSFHTVCWLPGRGHTWTENFAYKILKSHLSPALVEPPPLAKLFWVRFWCSPIKGFYLIVPLGATRDRQSFLSWLHVWCTPQSLTKGYDAHPRVWLHGGMHTTEFLENSNLSVKPKPDSKIICFPFFFFSLFGPRSSVADPECWCGCGSGSGSGSKKLLARERKCFSSYLQLFFPKSFKTCHVEFSQ